MTDLTNVNMNAVRDIINLSIQLDMMIQGNMIKQSDTKTCYQLIMRIGVSNGLTMVELLQAHEVAYNDCKNGYNGCIAHACHLLRVGEVELMNMLKDCNQVADEQKLNLLF